MAVAQKKRIGTLLVEGDLITPCQLEEGLSAQQKHGGKIVENLISLGYLTADEFRTFLAQRPGVATINLEKYRIPEDLLSLVQPEFALKHEILPIDRLGNSLTVGMVCPLDASAIEQLEAATGLRVHAFLCGAPQLHAVIERYYGALDKGKAAAAPVEEPTEIEALVPDVEEAALAVQLGGAATLLRKLDHLPALPQTVERVREAVNDPESSVEDLADIIRIDPALAAKVLSVANSAAFGSRQQISSVALAVSMLGFRETYGIVVGMSVADLLKGSDEFDYKGFWIRSMLAGNTAAALARNCGQAKLPGAYSASLLQNIGQLALAEVVPAYAMRVQPDLEGSDLVEAEQNWFGVAHPEAGCFLANQWGLPPEMGEAIRFHHVPDQATTARQLAAIVCISGLVASFNVNQSDRERGFLLDSCSTPLEILGMDVGTIGALLQI